MNRPSPREVRAALALTEQRRRERLRAAEQDHFGRPANAKRRPTALPPASPASPWRCCWA
jgi:hypothetical protein